MHSTQSQLNRAKLPLLSSVWRPKFASALEVSPESNSRRDMYRLFGESHPRVESSKRIYWLMSILESWYLRSFDSMIAISCKTCKWSYVRRCGSAAAPIRCGRQRLWKEMQSWLRVIIVLMGILQSKNQWVVVSSYSWQVVSWVYTYSPATNSSFHYSVAVSYLGIHHDTMVEAFRSLCDRVREMKDRNE